MKKIILATILVLNLATPATHAQGYVQLYNYGYPASFITYTPGGAPVTGGFTVGFYYGVGDMVAAQNAAMAGDGGRGLIWNLTLATGASAMAPLGTVDAGCYELTTSFGIPGITINNTTVTLVVVAYNGADYGSSIIRAHSQAFSMPARVMPYSSLPIGAFAPGFALIPEPSIFALTGLGLAGLLFFRRPKSRQQLVRMRSLVAQASLPADSGSILLPVP